MAPDDVDVISLAQSMIRIDTSHNGEGGNTLPYARLLDRIWRRAGVETEIVPTPIENNVHFLARIRGNGSKPPLLLCCHSDVVPAITHRWRTDPYAADVENGWLHGRGSLDMKGANAAFMSALLRHIGEGAVFDRDIIYLADCDEEGGWFGTRWLVDNHLEKVDAGVVITEGGWTLTQRDGVTPMLASMTCLDRTFGAVRLTARGTATHSSRPTADSAIVRLAAVVTALAEHQPDVVLTEINDQYFAALADATADPQFAEAIRALRAAPNTAARNAAGRRLIDRSPYPWLHNAMLRATVSYVVQDGGRRANVIPGEASVLLQLRFTPQGEPPRQVLSWLRSVLPDDSITMTVVGPPGESEQDTLARWERDWAISASPTDHDVFTAWQKAVHDVMPGTPAVAAMFEAGTSAKPWHDRGIPVYGIYPYAVDNDTLTRMHGDDERVRTSALRQGTELLYRMFAEFCVS